LAMTRVPWINWCAVAISSRSGGVRRTGTCFFWGG
jgi:hypothetical protein